MNLIKWATLLSVFWLLLSGYLQPLLLGFGLISVAIVIVVLKRMDDVDQEPRQVAADFHILQYLGWLVKEIFISSIQVTKLIWSRSDKLSPSLAKIRVDNVRPKNHVLYANSITLTPGTLSVDLENEEITVHALQKSSIEELQQGAMERKITSIWGENK